MFRDTYIIVQKFEVSNIFYKKYIILLSKDAFNSLKVTVYV